MTSILKRLTQLTNDVPPVVNQTAASKWHQQWKEMTCACGDKYLLGKTGTIFGCDRCQGISRDVNGMIIPDPFFDGAFNDEGG